MVKLRALYTAVLLLVVVATFVSVFQVVAVDGDSMMPTLHSGQIVLAQRRVGAPRKGDIVLLRRDKDTLVKRVSYLPNQTLDTLDRPLFVRCADYFETDPKARSLRVPAGRIVVMGDNRANSDDSRRFGPIKLGDIVGRVVAVSPFP